MLDTPILFIIFNRKDVALKSLAAIKKSKPKRMYIAGDGPRNTIEQDFDKVKNTREAIINAIDWDCEIKTLFQEDNLGYGNKSDATRIPVSLHEFLNLCHISAVRENPAF